MLHFNIKCNIFKEKYGNLYIKISRTIKNPAFFIFVIIFKNSDNDF